MSYRSWRQIPPSVTPSAAASVSSFRGSHVAGSGGIRGFREETGHLGRSVSGGVCRLKALWTAAARPGTLSRW
jgi:hypothetical protein